jgi:hypothetical protein
MNAKYPNRLSVFIHEIRDRPFCRGRQEIDSRGNFLSRHGAIRVVGISPEIQKMWGCSKIGNRRIVQIIVLAEKSSPDGIAAST